MTLLFPFSKPHLKYTNTIVFLSTFIMVQVSAPLRYYWDRCYNSHCDFPIVILLRVALSHSPTFVMDAQRDTKFVTTSTMFPSTATYLSRPVVTTFILRTFMHASSHVFVTLSMIAVMFPLFLRLELCRLIMSDSSSAFPLYAELV